LYKSLGYFVNAEHFLRVKGKVHTDTEHSALVHPCMCFVSECCQLCGCYINVFCDKTASKVWSGSKLKSEQKGLNYRRGRHNTFK